MHTPFSSVSPMVWLKLKVKLSMTFKFSIILFFIDAFELKENMKKTNIKINNFTLILLFFQRDLLY